MSSDKLGSANLEPRINHDMVAQVLQLESVRPGLFKHLIGIFDANALKLFQEIPERIANQEMEALRIAFHSMKGTSASLGAQRLSYIADIAESAAKGDYSEASMEDIVKCLREEFEAVRSELTLAAQSK
jgi:histidine phosphotransfer protein HptB